MLTVQITTSMAIYRIPVEQVEFVQKCPHCGVEFLTIDPDQQYPDKRHKDLAYHYRTRKLRPTRRSTFVDVTALKHA